jgi:hypothetical protein
MTWRAHPQVTRQARAAHTYGASFALQQQRPALQRPYLRLPCQAVRAVWRHFHVISLHAWEHACCTHRQHKPRCFNRQDDCNVDDQARRVAADDDRVGARARLKHELPRGRRGDPGGVAGCGRDLAVRRHRVLQHRERAPRGRAVQQRLAQRPQPNRHAGLRRTRAQVGCCSGQRLRLPPKQPCQRRPAEHGPPAERRAREAGF